MGRRPRTFSEKWSNYIELLGYTAVPNCLITCQVSIGITSSEFNVLVQILQYRFDDGMPYPSLQSIAKRSGLAVSSVRRNIRTLEEKGLIRRLSRIGSTNLFDVQPLIETLHNHDCIFAQKRTNPRSEISDPLQPQTTAKEDPGLTEEELNNILDSFAIGRHRQQNEPPVSLDDLPF